jgi:hypothetical protein
MKKLLLIALSTLAMGAQAAEKNKFHVGGGLSAWTMKADSDFVTGQLNLTALEGVATYDLLSWLNIDGRLGVGVESETETFRTVSFEDIPDIEVKPASGTTAAQVSSAVKQTSTYIPIKGSINYYASLLLKPQVKNDKAAFYGIVGVTFIDMEYDIGSRVQQVNTYLGSTADLSKLEPYAVADPTFDTTVAEVMTDSSAYLNLGLGVSFFFDRWTLNTEWKNMINSDEIGTTGFSFKTSMLSANVTYGF